jgi:hypothetical protein
MHSDGRMLCIGFKAGLNAKSVIKVIVNEVRWRSDITSVTVGFHF